MSVIREFPWGLFYRGVPREGDLFSLGASCGIRLLFHSFLVVSGSRSVPWLLKGVKYGSVCFKGDGVIIAVK